MIIFCDEGCAWRKMLCQEEIYLQRISFYVTNSFGVDRITLETMYELHALAAFKYLRNLVWDIMQYFLKNGVILHSNANNICFFKHSVEHFTSNAKCSELNIVIQAKLHHFHIHARTTPRFNVLYICILHCSP